MHRSEVINKFAISSLERTEIVKFLIIRTIGNFLVLISLVGVGLTFGQTAYQEGRYRFNQWQGVEYAVVTDEELQQRQRSGFGENTPANGAIPIIPVSTEFGIVIPRINANARVIPNVDPSNYDEYMSALRLGVAHAAGTVFPGMQGNVYFFAHSTDYFWNVGRYNAIFYLLKEVQIGDEVDIFYGGRRYIYIVSETKIINPDDVSYLVDSIGGEPRLTLQTCWPPGTTLKRLLVIAKPKINTGI